MARSLVSSAGSFFFAPDAPEERPFVRILRYLSCGGLLIGLSVYQIEYDFGVEQFLLHAHVGHAIGLEVDGRFVQIGIDKKF